MKNLLIPAVVCTALGVAALGSYVGGAQQQPAKPAPSADPYANNPDAGTQKFPLAAPAGTDSGARKAAPAGAANQGPFDPTAWKYGPAFNPPAGAKVWNPVKLKMMQGGKVTGGTLFSATDPATYCAFANAGYDFIWMEMQHNERDWQSVGRMWRTCPNARAVPGVRIAGTDEREIQHAVDAGALVLEDLGDETLEVALARAGSRSRPTRQALYRSAVRMAAEIASRGTAELLRSDRAGGPALDGERFRFEMRFFLEHYVGGYLGRPEVAMEVRDALDALALAAASHPRVLCHRDYHSRNIMVRADGALAMVDIQDARWGPDTYDLASLLRDAYVDLGDPEISELLNLFCGLLPGPPDVAGLLRRFEVTSAQRMLKALGTFGYQVHVLGRDRYRSAIPRTVERLARLLPASAATASLGEILLRGGVLHEGGRQAVE